MSSFIPRIWQKYRQSLDALLPVYVTPYFACFLVYKLAVSHFTSSSYWNSIHFIGWSNLFSNRGPGYSPQNGIAPINAWFSPLLFQNWCSWSMELARRSFPSLHHCARVGHSKKQLYGKGRESRVLDVTAIRMTSSSRDIYFHTPSRDQTKLWPVEKYWLESFIMSVSSPFLTNSFSSLLLITYQVFCYWPQAVYLQETAQN